MGEHHLLFERRLWVAHEPNKRLRSMPGLIIPSRIVGHETHDQIHREIAGIPVPHYKMGQTILSLYRDNPDDHFRSIDNLCFAVEEATKHPRAKYMETDLGQIIIATLEKQKELLYAGL